MEDLKSVVAYTAISGVRLNVISVEIIVNLWMKINLLQLVLFRLIMEYFDEFCFLIIEQTQCLPWSFNENAKS